MNEQRSNQQKSKDSWCTRRPLSVPSDVKISTFGGQAHVGRMTEGLNERPMRIQFPLLYSHVFTDPEESDFRSRKCRLCQRFLASLTELSWQLHTRFGYQITIHIPAYFLYSFPCFGLYDITPTSLVPTSLLWWFSSWGSWPLWEAAYWRSCMLDIYIIIQNSSRITVIK